jgi:hypothetical protein
MATPGLEIYAVTHHVPLEQLGALLKLGDTPAAELSAVDWQDRETVVDELATFFPFPRYFTREWEAVMDAVAEQVEKGKLVLVRGLTPAALPHLGLLIDYAAAALSREQQGKVQGTPSPHPPPTFSRPPPTPLL